MLSGGVGMFGTRKRGICSARGLFFSQRTQTYVLPANDIGDIHLDLWYSKCHPWNIVDPQDPHTASMNFYCSNHIFVVCETRFLHILQPNQHITAGWTWKYIWQSSFLKLKQMFKRFIKIQILPLSVMVQFGKNWIHFLKICSSSKHALFSGHLKINDMLNQNLSFNLKHGRYWWIETP